MTPTAEQEPSVSMVERVAYAIYARLGQGDEPQDFKDVARDAIAAMREPTEQMTHVDCVTPEGFAPYPNTCEVVWEAMIDAALADPTDTPR